MSTGWLRILAAVGLFFSVSDNRAFALDCSPEGAKPLAAEDYEVLKQDKYFIKVLGVESREVHGQIETIIGVVVKGSADEFKASIHSELADAVEVSCYHKDVWDGQLYAEPQYVWWESEGDQSTHTFKMIADRQTKQAKIVYLANHELVIQLK